MFTWGSKYFFGLAGAFVVAAIVYGLVTGGGPIGVISLGWFQSVGDHIGYAALMGLAAATFLMGVVAVWTRDADAEDVAALVGTPEVPPALPPVHPSFWGAVTAFGVGMLAIGVAVGGWFFIVGWVVLAVAALEWLVLAWTDRATGDPAANRTIRNRLMLPIEIPLLAVLAVAVFTLGASRIFLAVPSLVAVALASLIASGAFALAVAIAYRPQWFSRNVASGLIAAFAVVILAGGVVGAAVGPRQFHDYLEDHEPMADGAVQDQAPGGDEPGGNGAAGEGP
jgi:hypothetical protein